MEQWNQKPTSGGIRVRRSRQNGEFSRLCLDGRVFCTTIDATREAAALLNLPHPRLLQLIDDRAIASRMVNGRRRVHVVDLVTFKQAQAEASSAAMDEFTSESEPLRLGTDQLVRRAVNSSVYGASRAFCKMNVFL